MYTFFLNIISIDKKNYTLEKLSQCPIIAMSFYHRGGDIRSYPFCDGVDLIYLLLYFIMCAIRIAYYM
jgi:hypothetical protein